MTDRKLLEFSAKAYGVEVEFDANGTCWKRWTSCKWNPLDDDNGTLRLAVKLQISIEQLDDSGDGNGSYCLTGDCIFEYHESNAGAATRRAVVRAAAEMGKNIK